jgi:hypothetical protein
MLGCKPVSFPMKKNLKLTKDDGELLKDPSLYRRLIGRFLYLAVTRLDISYSIQKLSQFMNSLRKPRLHSAQRVLQYLKGTPRQWLFYSASNTLQLKGLLDSDWASCPDTRRFASGYDVFIGESL